MSDETIEVDKEKMEKIKRKSNKIHGKLSKTYEWQYPEDLAREIEDLVEEELE